MTESWHSIKIEDTATKLYSRPEGLSLANAAERLIKYGPNEIKEKKKKPLIMLFLSQFNSFIIWILFAAVILSFVMHDVFEGVLISIILLLNALVGFWQEYKAEKSIEALKNMAALKAKVIRDGKEKRIDARELVPGDIILLETGDKVPADARLIEAVRLEADESALTGESTTVKKDTRPVKPSASVAERTCMMFSSTTISKGRGRAIVVCTGMTTQIGNIAHMVGEAKDKQTPLQYKLSQLGEFLGIATLIVCAIVFFGVFLRGINDLFSSLEIAISLAVAAIPEGLAAVVTICLALGVQRMVKKNALVRVLPAVETLGSCNVICTDKTGTLTYNQMTVRELYVNNNTIKVTGQGYIPKGKFETQGRSADLKKIGTLLKIGALCNDASLREENGQWNIFGDPTEAALIVAARKAGFIKEDLDKEMPRTDELPFDSERKLMTTVHRSDKNYAYVKGAPDVLIERCDKVVVDGHIRKLSSKDKKRIIAINEDMANRALRVLGFAYKEAKGKYEESLIFVGLMGMIDPPRKEAMDAIHKCKDAGIKVVMITGDYKATAVAIGRELGLEVGKVLTGKELDQMTGLQDIVGNVSIYARVSPQHKMAIINALKAKKFIVAMTGDGVNDAPALKRADIGIAMGKAGTDVAKEASDMILTDDNFASIVNAVEEGRGIYDNIRKFVKYLLSSNLGEVLTIFIASMIAYKSVDGNIVLPLTAVQLLWINLLTDSFPALALGVDPTDPDVMKKPPRKSSDSIISKSYAWDMVFVGIIMTLGTLFIFYYGLQVSEAYAVTMAFTVLVVFQLFNVLNCKSDEKSIFKVGILNNKWLLAAIGLSLALQVFVVYAPAMYAILDAGVELPASLSGINMSEKLGTDGLRFVDWIIVFVIGSTVLVFEEVKKFIARRIR